MNAWLLIFTTGWASAATVPNIATEADCTKLAMSLHVVDYQCLPYKVVASGVNPQ